MSQHPGLTPRLGRSSVVHILSQIDAEITETDLLLSLSKSSTAKLIAEARQAGLQKARQIVSDTWNAEVATAAAVAQWLSPDHSEEDPCD